MVLERLGQIMEVAFSALKAITPNKQHPKIISENEGIIAEGQQYRQKTIKKELFKGNRINIVIDNLTINLNDKR